MTNPLDIEHTTSCGHTWTMRHTACPDCFAEMRQRAVAAEAEVERLRDEVARLANLNIHIGDDAAKDRAEVERLKDTQRKFGVVQHELSKAVELALDLFENGLVDFKKYGLRQDSDIADLYRSALRGGGE